MIVVRPLTANDRSAHDDLLRELDAAHRAALPHLIRAPEDAAISEARYLAYLADPEIFFAVVELDGRVAGFIRASFVANGGGRAHLPRRFARVEEIVVTSAARRRGLGRALMMALRGWAASKGAKSLELSVYAFNAEAAAFYAREGFEVQVTTFSAPL